MEEEDVQERQQGGQEGAGDPNDGDDSDKYNSDDDDDGSHGGDEGEGGNEDNDRCAALLAEGWTVELHYDLQCDDYYHPKLVTLVRRFHPRGTVQYRAEHWIHPRNTRFCETKVYIHEESRVRFIHRAITARLTRATSIEGVARQAMVVNRDHHFDDIEWEEDRYLPRRPSGQSSCNIAAPMGEENFRLRPTLECLAKVNTDLDQTLDELDAMGKAYLQLAHEHAVLKQQLGGPDLDVPGVPAESPPRNRGGHGDPRTNTNIDP